MKKSVLILATLTFATPALALPATLPAGAKLLSQPNKTSAVVATLPAGTKLDVKSCTGGSQGWCKVTAGSKVGFLPRAVIKAQGNCAALQATGFGGLRKGEASYNGQRDRDGDGLGCDNRG